MKKWIAILLTLTVALAFAACKGGDSGKPSQADGASASQKADTEPSENGAAEATDGSRDAAVSPEAEAFILNRQSGYGKIPADHPAAFRLQTRQEEAMRYPEFLKAGDTIGFAAPSFGCNIEPYRSCFDRAQEVLRKKGFGILCGPNVYAGDGIGISTAPELCGREFTELYVSDACEAVLSCGGGELMCEILKYVDFEAIARAEPKWFMGYSDNTNLVFTLTTLCDTAAIYGPCAPAFGMKPWHPAIREAFQLLCGRKFSLPAAPGEMSFS